MTAEALAASGGHAGPIDLLITDLIMPGRGGTQLAAQLKAARPDLKVLYITGYAQHAAETGLTDNCPVLTKPFSPRELAARVRAVLRRTERASAETRPNRLTHGPIELDAEAFTLYWKPARLRYGRFNHAQVFLGNAR